MSYFENNLIKSIGYFVKRLITTRRILFLVFAGFLCFVTRTIMKYHAYGLKRTPHQHWITLLKKNFVSCDRNPMDWLNHKFTACDGHFTGYGHQFAVLNNAIVVPDKQFFYIPCQGQFSLQYEFEAHGINDLNIFTKNVLPMDNAPENALREAMNKVQPEPKTERTTFAVARDKARGNLWHTMTEWYNIFLISKMLNISIDSVDILAYETFTEVGLFDHAWRTLFDNLEYSKDVKQARLINKMVWNIQNYMSPLEFFCMQELPPFFEDFKNFILRKYKIPMSKQSVDCKNVTIFFLWRRDFKGLSIYPDKILSRKIMNIDELVDNLKRRFPAATIRKEATETMTLEEQIKTFTDIDIVISPHGAGLTHLLFVPRHAGVLEIFPAYTPQFPDAQHYKNLARYRQLKYLSWNNHNPNNEYQQFNTYVPPLGVEARVQELYAHMCS